MSGKVVGAAIVSHHPGLMQCEEFRKLQGNGADSDLIAGYTRLRERISAAQPDLVIIFDTHWFTTGYHLVDGGEAYEGMYISDEMPWYLHGVPYRYRGNPAFARLVETVSREQGGFNRAVRHPDLARHYATINLVKQLDLEMADIPVVSVSSCQNCNWADYLVSGQAIDVAIERSGLNVVMLASGALSHKFNNIDWKPSNPRIFDAENVSSPDNRASDLKAIELLREGRHDTILENWEQDYRQRPWEAFGAHYLQMVGAMGGANCRLAGETLSEYENARGTGNIHIWFAP